MQLVPHRPQALRSVFGLGREFERALDQVFDAASQTSEESQGEWIPPVDVRYDQDAIDVWADLPGMSKDEVEIFIEGNRLTIRGDRERDTRDSSEATYMLERPHGKFQRTFVLTSELDAGKAEADYRQGVLHISIPKLEEAKPKRLQIKAS
jgi:HSP20 family protein